MGSFSRDLEWLYFYARYCAGENIGKPFCDDFLLWAGVAVSLVVLAVALWILGKLWRHYKMWEHDRAHAAVADTETMKQHRWTGYDSPDAKPASGKGTERKPKKP